MKNNLVLYALKNKKTGKFHIGRWKDDVSFGTSMKCFRYKNAAEKILDHEYDNKHDYEIVEIEFKEL